ncbi:MAG: hypothetical protein Q9219_004092 [cf. Caloplaca sp. 3 TL-2023]
MAWVRPKHPKPKPKADPIDTLVPMLSYISNRRVTSRSSSPTKQTPHTAPLSRDPILRSFQQAQALQVEDPISDPDDEPEEPDHESQQYQPSQPPRQKPLEEQKTEKKPRERMVTHHHQREPSPPPTPPPPPRIARQQPRVASYERYRPAETPREMINPRYLPQPTYRERASRRAVSARWASATTPLDLR